MKLEIATTKGDTLAKELNKLSGVTAKADSEGVMAEIDPRAKKQVVAAMKANGFDDVDIKDAYPELLEAKEEDPVDDEVKYTIDEDGSVTFKDEDETFVVPAKTVEEVFKAIEEAGKKKKVNEGVKSFAEFYKMQQKEKANDTSLDNFL